jgi:hypothetical protein
MNAFNELLIAILLVNTIIKNYFLMTKIKLNV